MLLQQKLQNGRGFDLSSPSLKPEPLSVLPSAASYSQLSGSNARQPLYYQTLLFQQKTQGLKGITKCMIDQRREGGGKKQKLEG